MECDVIVIRGYSIGLQYQEVLYPEIITVVIPIMPEISGFRTITELISKGSSVSRKRFGRSLVSKLLGQRKLYSYWKTSSGVDLCDLLNKCDLNSEKIKETVINVMYSYFYSIGRTYNVQDSYIIGKIHVPSAL